MLGGRLLDRRVKESPHHSPTSTSLPLLIPTDRPPRRPPTRPAGGILHEDEQAA
jgi:hypothetical protein